MQDGRELPKVTEAPCATIRHGSAMLELRPNCECCDRDLPPGSELARICSFECTFCVACVETRFAGTCPNCGGDIVPRPIRPVAELAVKPASTARRTKAHRACL